MLPLYNASCSSFHERKNERYAFNSIINMLNQFVNPLLCFEFLLFVKYMSNVQLLCLKLTFKSTVCV